MKKTVKCPECGDSNENSALYCVTCGHDLYKEVLDLRSRILFFATPPFLLCLGMAMSWDLGSSNPFEIGTEWGLLLSFVFLIFGGGFWMTTRFFGLSLDSIAPWQAGIFAVFQLLATLFLTFPLKIQLLDPKIVDLNIEAHQLVNLSFFLVFFVPLTLLGLFLLGKKKNKSGPLLVFAFSLIAPVIFIFALSEVDQNYLIAEIKGELSLSSKAINNLDSALKVDPNSPRLLHAKGRLLMRESPSENAQEASELFAKTVELEPQNAVYHFSYAITLEVLGRTTEAIEAASTAAHLKPGEPQYLIELGNLHIKLFQREEAIEAYKKALPLKPEEPFLLNNIAYIFLELNRELPLALKLARKAAEKRPDSISTLDTLAWALYLNGSTAEAFTYMQKVKKEGKGNPAIEYHYAVIANDLKLLPEPKKTLRQVLKLAENTKDKLFYEQVYNTYMSLPEPDPLPAEDPTPTPQEQPSELGTKPWNDAVSSQTLENNGERNGP